MSSFLKLWESINSQNTKSTDQAAAVIRSGVGLNENFWKEFILLMNNSKGLSELLDVPLDKVSTWHQRILSKMQEVEAEDTNTEVNKNKKLIKTGKASNEIV